MGTVSNGRTRPWSAFTVAMLLAAAASAQTGQTAQPGPQTEKPQSPETAPAREPNTAAAIPGVVNLGPSREVKLGPDTWFRFAVQVQAWALARQDRVTTGGDGSYGYDLFCRRCRFFTTGSVVRNVFFNFLVEATPGRADPITGVKAGATPQLLDAYGQIRFADAFSLSAGNILMPLSRNGTQPTTTYLTLDTANITSTPVLQGNSFVLRDLGIQANGFLAANHVEYRVGVFQGSRQAETTSGTLSATGACVAPACTVVQSAGHNAPRLVTSLLLNFLDPEVGYVSGGHYYGTKEVLGVMGNFDYQQLRRDGPGAPSPLAPTVLPPAGTEKNPYYGFSAAAFFNYPLSGHANPRGGDELAGLLQFGLYDGGFTTAATGATTNQGTYPNVLKQTNYLGELAYFNQGAKASVFGKFEMRKISDDYIAPLKAASNQTWVGGGLKYYIAPANLMNLTLQYERVINNDAPGGQQRGANNFTLAWQTILY